MANLADLENALVNAHRAGDVPAAQKLARAIQAKRSASQSVENDAITQGAKNFNAESGFFKNAASGAGKALADIGLGFRQITGNASQQEVDETKRRDAALMDTGGGLVGNIAGNVAISMLPGLGAAGVGKTVGAPALAAGGKYLLSSPATLGGVLTQGGMGALQAGAQPTATGESRLGNATVGFLAGGAVPALGMAVKGAKAGLEPFYEGGQDAIIGRTLRRVAGDQADDAARSLASAQELVPGSIPTVGQAANNPGLAALERTASAIDPSVTNQYAGRMASQNTARLNVLSDLAGEDGARALAVTERASTADDLYKQAYGRGIDITRNAATGQFNTKGQIAGRNGEITKLLRTPAIQQAVKDARALAANEMVNLKNPAGSVQGLDYVKRALDDQIANSTGNEQRILQGLKERLLTTIDTLSPEYSAARQVFADMSKRVNQFDTAAEILNKSVRPLDGQVMPSAYARALNDQTAQRATGFNKATLSSVFEPEQLAKLMAIKDDLARAEYAKNAGRGVGSDTIQKLAYSNFVDSAGIPTFLRNLGLSQAAGNLAGRGADVLYGRANKELASKLAELLLDPQQAGALMQSAIPNAQLQMLGRGLLATGSPLAIGTGVGLLSQ